MGRPSARVSPGQLGFDLAEHTVDQLPGLVARAGWRPPAELPSLRGVRRLALDLETCDPELSEHGPGFRTGAYPVGLAIGLEGGGRFYLPTRHAGGGNLDEGLVKRWAREELGAYRGEVVGANLSYDLDGLATCWDVHLPEAIAFHDVQVAEPLLDEHRLEYSLDSLARDYLGEGKDEGLLREAAAYYGATTPKAVKKVLWRLPAGVVGPYAEGDVDRPLRIFPLQWARMEAEGLLRVYDVERRLIPILVAMRRRGVRVDAGRARELRARLVRERDGWAAKLRHMAGPKAELTEPASIGPALEAAGIHVPRTAKTGQYSVTKPFLERYVDSVPLVQAVMAGRKLNTMVNTFLDSQILGHAVGGRVHPTFHQLKGDDGGTIGRFSGANPNLQFIPSREEDWQDAAGLAGLAPLIRGLFQPEEGEEWQRDDACLTGDTIIVTIDGPKTIEELIREPVPVLSTGDCNTLEFRPVVAARKTGRCQVLEMTMEDGSVVRCTGNHRWMKLNNEPIFTRDIKRGQRLSHVRDGRTGSGMPTWYIKSNRIYWSKHVLVAEYAHGARPDGHDVDHRDRNHEHWWRNNLRYLPVEVNRGQAAGFWWNDATDEQRQEKMDSLQHGIKTKRRSYVGAGNPNYGKKRPGVGGRPSHRSYENHKVLSVKPCGYEDVYDIEVEHTHTFVLANGLVSHNSQIEYRLLTHFAIGQGADEARAAYVSDPKTDFHKMAATWLNVDPEDKVRRKRVKNTNFCKVYGGGIDKIASTFNCSRDEAAEFVRVYDDRLPFVGQTYDAAMRWAARRGFVTTVLDRRQRFPLWEPMGAFGKNKKPALPRERALEEYGPRIQRAATYTALNKKLQVSAADLMKKGMVDAWEAGVCDVIGPFLVTVHDELGNSVPRTRAGDEAGREVTRCMERAVELRVPVLVEMDRGPDWGAVS